MNDASHPELLRSHARDEVARLPPETKQRGAMLLAVGALLGEVDVLPSGFVRARIRSEHGAHQYAVSGHIARDIACSCSAKKACQHLAAVLIYLQNDSPPWVESNEHEEARRFATRPSVSLDEWLGHRQSRRTAVAETLVYLLDIDAGQATVRLARHISEPTEVFRPLSLERFDWVMRGQVSREGLGAELESLTWSGDGRAVLTGALGAFGLGALLEAKKVFLWAPPKDGVPMRLAPPRTGALAWHHLREGTLQTSIDLGDPSLALVRTSPPYYVDRRSGAAGLVEAAGDVSRWLAAPLVTEAEIPQVRKSLASWKGVPVPRAKKTRRIAVRPLGRVRLFDNKEFGVGFHCAMLSFYYAEAEVSDGYQGYDGVSPYIVDTPTERLSVKRNLEAEEAIEEVLTEAGLSVYGYACGTRPRFWTVKSMKKWKEFVVEGVDFLRARGIEVVIDPSFSLRVIDEHEYFARIKGLEGEWFEIQLGIVIANERVDLLPLLLEAIRLHGAPVRGEGLDVILPSGATARVPHARLEPLLDVLIQLAAVKYEGGGARVSRWLAMDLAESFAPGGTTAEALRDLRASLTRTRSLPNPQIPKAFRATLRDYQRAGVSWLAFLAEHGLGGVLADDMGLGKTVQVIALLCSRRARKAEHRPSLVVAPTSVLLTWTDQLERFAPHLKVVVWHGKTRSESASSLKSADVVLTSYALLYRELATFRSIAWDTFVLDEAQAIKNPDSVAGKAARLINANQRLAVTGTPLQNHLGELWSIFAFVAPGLLGTKESFQGTFRTPIEKYGVAHRMETLRRRIAPLLLRRTKEEVASELPPKTFIEHRIEFGEAQGDLYETIRKSVDKRVRKAIAARGLALSKMVVLDALLKLRQVCCEPALLKVEAPKKQAPSAKREAFNELVDTLVAEGRSVLVFSQFVEMLELLAADLRKAHISFSYLTGDTVNRASEVDRFQSGAVPVFLISLKSGGVGLNLTAADTVIHYDPWWNPAVEMQATDRAHRIGQDKPVFVHRLIAHGTVEEKMVELQARKAGLAAALLEGGTRALTLDEALIDELLAPLPA